MYHSQQGLFFERKENSVLIVKTNDNKQPVFGDNSNVVFSQELPHAIWASVMSAVCKPGYVPGVWHQACQFHGV